MTGALVGEMRDGAVENASASGKVSGGAAVGGLVGYSQDSLVEQSYATGDVLGDRRVGGLIGGNYENVTESYAAGEVSGNVWVGGLVGQNGADGGLVQRSYWNTETTGQSKAVGDEEEGYGEETVENVEGLTTSEMQGTEAEENMQELNFSGAWKTAGNDYLKLKWQENDSGEGLPGFTIIIALLAFAVGTIAVARKN